MRLVVVFAIACSTPAPKAPPIGPPLGATHARETTEIEPPSLAVQAEPPAPSAPQRLLAATNQLDTAIPRPDHMDVVSALRALADALEVIAPDKRVAILRIRQAADNLPVGDTRANIVRTALEAATQALTGVVPRAPTDRARLDDAVSQLREATRRIAPDDQLLTEYAGVRLAFRAAVRAVFAATSAPEPDLTAER